MRAKQVAVLVLVLLGSGACGSDASAPSADPIFADVSAGPEHACGVTTQGAVYCWGRGELGELGQGLTGSTVPVAVAIQGTVDRVSAGYSHSCAHTIDGDVFCWGWGIHGQLGTGAVTVAGPVQVAGELRFSSISSGWYHTCGIADAGSLYCWGLNARGQLGDGSRVNRVAPVRVGAPQRFVAVSAGAEHTCALAANGTGYCWGSNAAGRLGTGQAEDAVEPRPVATDLRFSSISAGLEHTCAVALDTLAHCWGGNSRGELGNSATEREVLPGKATPSSVTGDRPFVSISAGYHYSCGILTNRRGYCWGAGLNGQLGTGMAKDFPNPQSVAAFSGGNAPDPIEFAVISARGLTYACGVTTARVAVCWGRGPHGQLGQPSIAYSTLPIRIAGPR